MSTTFVPDWQDTVTRVVAFGTTTEELCARTDVFLGIHEHSSVDDVPLRRWKILSAVFRRLNDWQQIATLQNHLADTLTDENSQCADDYEDRVSFWHDLADINECLYNAQRDVCRACKCMEGLHRSSFKLCPIQPGIEMGPQLLSSTFTR